MITDALPTDADRDAQIALICEEISDRVRAGHSVDVDEYAARWPQYAAELRDLVPAMQALAALPVGETESPIPAESLVLTEPLGDFRIERPLGRGGMGVVYEARQMSLGRKVALKVLPLAAVMDPRHLARFKNEALAAAGLNHPHIVPVYAVGEERGVHFYAMQLIRGQNLAEIIAELRLREGLDPAGAAATAPSPGSLAKNLSRERPAEVSAGAPETANRQAAITKLSSGKRTEFATYCRNVAQIVRDAAEAIGSAHAEGVIHRDLKPSNLMLDVRGKVWVTDFGLAQMRGGSNLTMTGDMVGTLRYMSPEQAAGKHSPIDHRTDVYSLGATLYELLTLRPMFPSTDHAELLRQIASVEPTPLRRVRKEIPADLETIVLKAVSKSASDRYATMRDLAEDLERFIEDQPIKAKPIGVVERTRRIVRRHSALLAVALGISLFLTTALGVAFWLTYVARDEAVAKRKEVEKKGKELEKKREELEEQNEQNKKLLARINQTLFFLGNLQDGSQFRQAILLEEIKFYREIKGTGKLDIPIQLQMATSLQRIGKLQSDLSLYAEVDQPLWSNAESSLQDSIELLEALAAKDPHSNDYAISLCESWEAYGRVARFKPDLSLAETRLAMAIECGNRGIELPQNRERGYRALYHSWHSLADVQQENGRADDAIHSHARAVDFANRNLAEHPNSFMCRLDAIVASSNHALCLYNCDGDVSEVKAIYQRALSHVEQLPPNEISVADTIPNILAGIYRSGGHTSEELSRLLAEIRRLGEAQGADITDVALLSWCLSIAGNRTTAEQQLALDLASRCDAMKPGDPECQALKARAYYRLGDYSKSMDCWLEVVRAKPSQSAVNLLFAAMCCRKVGQVDKAAELFGVAKAFLDSRAQPGREIRLLLAEAQQVLSEPATATDMSPTSPPENDPPADPANSSD